MALKDIQKDSRLYSGWNRYKVITADLAPVIFGTALGSGGVAVSYTHLTLPTNSLV